MQSEIQLRKRLDKNNKAYFDTEFLGPIRILLEQDIFVISFTQGIL